MGSSAPTAIGQAIRPVSPAITIPGDTTDSDALLARRAREHGLSNHSLDSMELRVLP